jgi:hypothetical protein
LDVGHAETDIAARNEANKTAFGAFGEHDERSAAVTRLARVRNSEGGGLVDLASGGVENVEEIGSWSKIDRDGNDRREPGFVEGSGEKVEPGTVDESDILIRAEEMGDRSELSEELGVADDGHVEGERAMLDLGLTSHQDFKGRVIRRGGNRDLASVGRSEVNLERLLLPLRNGSEDVTHSDGRTTAKEDLEAAVGNTVLDNIDRSNVCNDLRNSGRFVLGDRASGRSSVEPANRFSLSLELVL